MPALIGAAYAEDSSAIPSAHARAATLQFAHNLTTTTKMADASPQSPEIAPKSPFALNGTSAVGVSGEGVATPVAAVPVEVTIRKKLEAISPQVTPSGTVEIGGNPILLFGQKKVKVGDRLAITFEGQPYELEISDIQRTSFTLRLNGEEITRPIKSVIKPKS